jgi:rubrerythrin
MRAFAGECQSRQRYYQAALTAQQQKLVGLERMFRFTAEQEERHAMVFWKLLKEGTGQDIDISAGFPADVTEEIQKLLDASEREEKKGVFCCVSRFCTYCRRGGLYRGCVKVQNDS